MVITDKKEAIKAGLGDFYQKMLDFSAINKDENELPGLAMNPAYVPLLILQGGEVIVGLQSDFIRPIGIDRLPKPWHMIRTDESEGEQLLEVAYELAEISDNIPRRAK